ncbi:phosphotriesterase [Oceanicola sp. 502str15]|uniref:phosphotriesterase family protein n=1 Tax=Oceanicola sp. 502str15 TaxID=2696061 RepID=UPI002095B6EF|nr:hypothetical protein [Oceanicola sp. 502str15]MCO6385304.1 phosphotriesterase-related protein [Oceanicola sp. 502str15]
MRVNTVLGPVDSANLGRTLIHEHLFASWPGAMLDPELWIDREDLLGKCIRRMGKLKDVGIRTFVDPCPNELGRDVSLMVEVAEKTGMNIICATGFYHEGPGIPYYWRDRAVEDIAAFYIHEIENGVGNTGVKPGAIKCATSATPTLLEEKFLTAAAIAHKKTGVPIITHTTQGLGGPEQQKLFASNDVAPHCCLIGHCSDNTDPAYHRAIVEGGNYIGFDRIGFDVPVPEVIADNSVKLVQDGFGPQLMMSMDSCCYFAGRTIRKPPTEDRAELRRLIDEGIWPPDQTYLFHTFFPLLRERGLTDAEILPILDENPIRFFSHGAL